MSGADPSAQLETVLSGNGKRKELSKHRPTSTLSAAQAQHRAVHLGSELHSSEKELLRIRSQYEKASAERKLLKKDAGRAELLHTDLDRELARTKQELSTASSRLEIFEQAAAARCRPTHPSAPLPRATLATSSRSPGTAAAATAATI